LLENKNVQILMAEDDPLDAEMTLRALSKHDLAGKVHWVRDGAEALDFLFSEGVYAGRGPERFLKLVLLDIKMPKVDGIEVLRRVKSDDRTRLIPVVVMTSSSEDRDLVESYRLGVNSYVVKPVEAEAFLRVVSEIGIYWTLRNRAPTEAGSA